MKTTRYLFLVLLTTLIGMGAKAQQRNVLQVPDVTMQTGSAQLPVSIENTDEIVGVQFDLTLPQGITAEQVGTMSSRGDGHSVTVSRLGSGAYRVLLHSPQNRPLRGQSGVVMYLPVNIPSSIEEGSEHPLTVSNAVLGKATGENVLTEALTGKIRIAKQPDLTVKNVSCDKQTFGPGDRIVCSWQVENIGELPTGGGWSEQVSLVSEDGTLSKLIATTHYDDILDASGIVSRQAEITLPALLGIDEQARLQVRLVPDRDAGEDASAQGNNTLTSANTIIINKVLTMELSPNHVEENVGSRIALRVNRSGRWTTEETFTLSFVGGDLQSPTTDSRVTLPAQVTIPVGQSGAIVYMTVTDNDVLDDNETIVITAAGNGYPDATVQLNIEDNEYPDLTLTASKSILTEAETFQLTVSTSRVSSQPIEVTITSENIKRFSFPQKVTIAAGEASATVDVTAIEDDVPSLELSNVFTASAPKYNKAEAIILLQDNDLPVLELQLTPTTVQESAGVVAVAGVLRRTTNTNSKITVKLTDNADGGLYFGNRTLTLEKGVEEVHFNFGPIDNANVDGDRTYTITAAVWLSSCSCNASGESAGYVEAQLQVLDNDGPALSITSSLSTVKEGGNTMLTVSRNTTNTSAPLTVTLNSDYEEGLTYNHTVTIPAGQQSATVEVASAANSTQGDSHTVIFTVESDGYAKGTCFIMVTDQTLPDARISSITANVTEAEVGTKTKLTIEVVNNGAAELPAEVAVKVYRRGENNAVGTVYTSEAIAIGESLTMNKTITLPTAVGNHSYYAVVNESNNIQELTYNNNTSTDVTIATVAPFSVTVSTNKAIYQQGEKIVITGQLTGNGTSNANVDLYLINEGSRQVQSVKTDETGSFIYEWELYALQSGHFAVGACYPGEGLNTDMATFDVYGLRRTEYSNITCDVTCGDTHNGSLGLKNPGNLSLTGVSVELLSVPETCEAHLTVPATIEAGQEVLLSYSLKGLSPTLENRWEEIKAKVNTNEGVSLDITLYFYCRSPRGKIMTSTNNLVTTMTKGKTREYSIQVTNIGRGNTGKVSLALPDFIKSLAGNNLPSINQSDTLTIPLSFTPTEDMQLNVPITGQFGVNCENGDGTAVNFSITPVSEETGTLLVDVCDEYTYYTEEAPHVENAEVIVRNPVTGTLVAQGQTGADGLFTVILPEGYYKLSVTANNHDSYVNNIFVEPGTETRKIINLSTQSITVDWKVEETEVEDEYEIVTTLNYETNVPSPVVELVVPKSLDVDALGVGESLVFYAVLTNKGLITAQDAELILPEGFKRVTFEPLTQYQGLTIAPQQSISIPVKVTRLSPTASRGMKVKPIDNDPCVAQPGTLYYWDCGTDRKWHRYWIVMQIGSCNSNDPSTWGGGGGGYGGYGGGSGLGSPNGGGGGFYGSSSNTNNVSTSDEGCEPCQNKALVRAVQCAGSFIPYYGCAQGVYLCGKDLYNGNRGWRTWVGCAITGVGCFADFSGLVPLGIAADALGCLVSMTEPCEYEGNSRTTSRKVSQKTTSTPDFMKEFQSVLPITIRETEAFISYYYEFFGDSIWLKCESRELVDLLNALDTCTDELLDINAFENYKPDIISQSQFETFIRRLNNTQVPQSGETNFIDSKKLNEYINKIRQSEEESIALGYSSTEDLWNTEYSSYMENLQSSSKTVCASITLQFKQTMTMTRQAFRGTLTVFNGNETTAMTDMKLTLNVTNLYTGEVATSQKFQINAESLDGFTGALDLGSGWTLDANSTGTATVLFIPTKYAAPTEPVEWSFGGTLSYIDPFTGLEVTRELYPVTLTVKPSPELDLTYFMQRDVYGDDPLTLDVVESMKPAEFALLINNKGYGDATNVRMVTQQPEIIENEKGLKIDFELISSQVNGGEAALSFGQSIANDFGTIPAHSQIYAQWWLTSTLLGHFTDYRVEANHVTSYGNEDLSLLDEVTIHELIHGFDMASVQQGSAQDETPMRALLVNDIADANDMPDKLYFTNGETANVDMASTATAERTSPTTYILTITPSATGWNYGSVLDPTHGYAELKSIIRQIDGQELGNSRFWQTDRTLRDGKDWLYEHRLHFVDEFTTGGEQTYLLTFDPVPETVLEVTSIGTVPAEGQIAVEPIEALTVDFNKVIDATTFTGDDITFAVQGVKKNANQIGISTEDNKRFTLDMTAMNDTLPNGYYTLTVQTTDITDTEGYQGKGGKQVGWIMFRGGLVNLLTSTYPKMSGTVSYSQPGVSEARSSAPGDADNSAVAYGSRVMLEATPAAGYEFTSWSLNGEVVSTDRVFETTALGDMDVVANFTKENYMVTVSVDGTGGTVEGTATGIYEYGTEINVTAVPDEDYVMGGWTVNGEPAPGSDNTLLVIADKALDIQATFLQEYFRQSMTLARGWNWVSSYLNEPLSIAELSRYANRIVSQTDELINDPEYGMVGGITELDAGKTYKVQATMRNTNSFRGHLYKLATTPISLFPGWNWIAYPYMEKMPLNRVVTNAEEGEYIASQTGFAQYGDGIWEGTLDMLTPGEGYLYKSLSEKSLAFDFTTTVNNSRAYGARTAAATADDVDIHRWPSTMNMVARLYRDGMELDGSTYNIYAVADNELRGVSQYVGSSHYMTVYGDKPAEVTFIVESALTGDSYAANERLTFRSDVVGSRKSPFALNIGNATGIDSFDSSSQMTVYTLEGVLVSRDATLKTLHRLPKGVYIVNGRKCFIK